MHISDWSSDVCSSDLHERLLERQRHVQRPVEVERILLLDAVLADVADAFGHLPRDLGRVADDDAIALGGGVAERELQEMVDLFEVRRSEERGVGMECVRTCRTRWWRYT